MMQENSHVPVLTLQNWPSKSSQSEIRTVVRRTLAHDVNSMKKPDVMNGIHKEGELNTTDSSPLRVESSVGCDSIFNSKQTKVKWTLKNLTKREDGKQLSNINSWLSSQKLDDKSSLVRSSSNGSLQSQMTPGFDLAKLYPELSSKLGLIKSPSNESSSKSSIVKSSNNIKSLSHGSRNYSISSNEVHEAVFKSTSAKAINSNNLSKSQSYDKYSGYGTLAKSRFISISNDIKKNVNVKNKDKLDLTKLSEDKLKKFVSCQSFNSKIPLSSAHLKCDSKNKPVNRLKTSTISLFDVVCDKTFPSSFTYPPGSGSSLKPNKISILPKCSPSPLPNHRTLSPTQLRVHNLYQEYYAYNSNLFPLGYESSESDASDEDVGEGMNTLPECLLRCKEDTRIDPSLSHNPTLLLQHYRQQVLSAKERLKIHEKGLKRRWALTRALLEAARANPNTAASTVSHFVKKLHSVLPSKRKQSKNRSSLLVQRNCVYEGESGSMCGQRAVPGTRHCMRHVTYNVDQQLFSQCAAKKEDNSLCRIPTFNLLHEYPLCQQHADSQIAPSIAGPNAESVSKTKRSRKKNKMPILSRYGKRNKKRRRSSLGSTSIVPSTSVRPPINSPGVCLGSPHSTSPLTPHTSPTFSTPCSDPTGGGDESEFEDEFEGMVGGLPLEARDLQDVLNKIPEHEFSQILYGSDAKLGDGNEDDDKKNRSGTVSKTSSDPPPPPPPPLTPICLDEGALGELISSSFNQQELNAISQVLSNIVGDGALDLGGEFQDTQTSSTVGEPNFSLAPEPPTPPVYLSEDSNSGSVQSPQDIPSPAGGSTTLLQPNAKLKVNPTL